MASTYCADTALMASMDAIRSSGAMWISTPLVTTRLATPSPKSSAT
jgi:hypothetical protein